MIDHFRFRYCPIVYSIGAGLPFLNVLFLLFSIYFHICWWIIVGTTITQTYFELPGNEDDIVRQ